MSIEVLLPILHAAKSLPEFNTSGPRPRLQEDKLYFNGIRYAVDNLSRLPKQLHPENVSTLSKNGTTAFYSRSSLLSNHYPAKFKVAGEMYSCMEQFFMIAKAIEFGDQETVVKIKAETDPIKMKRLGKTVKNYNNHHWLSVAEERIMPRLTAKFSQNSHLKQLLLSPRIT